MSRSTVYSWIKSGFLPAKRLGNAVRIDRQAFERWYREKFTTAEVRP